MTLFVRTLTIVALVLGSGVAENPSFSHSNGSYLTGLGRRAPEGRRVSIHEVWTANTSTHSDSQRLQIHGRSYQFSELERIGRGKGIVFSPDLAEPGSREFYRALGFAYFEDPDWHVVLGQIREFNQSHPEEPIEALLIQSHGTNGDALKLQNSSQPDAPRSYIAPAALQENLDDTGVRVCLLAACNAGRLFRPENYLNVRAGEDNHLFEPATLGVINASAKFDPAHNSVTIVRRVESHIEVINECRVSELSAVAQAGLVTASDGRLNPSSRIAIPEMLIQLLLRDDQLRLVAWGEEIEKSRAETNDTYREHLIRRFLRFVDQAGAKP